jgi:hypothetical protein
MIFLWLIVWFWENTPKVEWFGPVWNTWGITLLISICLL